MLLLDQNCIKKQKLLTQYLACPVEVIKQSKANKGIKQPTLDRGPRQEKEKKTTSTSNILHGIMAMKQLRKIKREMMGRNENSWECIY